MGMITNPHLLPKVRSASLMAAAPLMPCCLRIAGFAGRPCAPKDTNVMCHLPVHGKGVGTKVSDLSVVCGCAICHDLIDGRNPQGLKIRELYPHAFWERVVLAHFETRDRWIALGVYPMGDDWKVV